MEHKNDNLAQISKAIRRDIIEMAYHAGGATHPGPALSSADIIAALYFKVMNIKPEDPGWADRDRLVLSKGHACPVIYAALAEKGYFDKKLFYTLRFPGSILQGHPDMKKTPGIDMTAGSLGHGLSAGLGMALALKLRKSPARVYVILGDGELNEGVVWEAAMSAANLKADNLTAIIDYNHFQSGGCTDEIQCLEPLADKWKAFGWRVFEANGHDADDIVNKLEMAKRSIGTPVVIIAHTTKGKGVSYMENNNAWHQRKPTEAEYLQALKELE